MNKPDLKGLTKEQLDYVNYLQDWIERFDASNIKKLIVSIDEVSGIIADDIRIIANSKEDDDEIDSKLQMLGSKKNKIYERFLSLIGQIKHFKGIGDMISEMKPTISETKDNSPEDVFDNIKPMRRNISDLAKSNKYEGS